MLIAHKIELAPNNAQATYFGQNHVRHHFQALRAHENTHLCRGRLCACLCCQAEHDRDINAAINLMNLASVQQEVSSKPTWLRV